MSAASTAAAASTATAAVEQSSAATAAPKRSRRAGTRPGPALHANCSETKRLAAAILEVLAGVRSPADAAKTLEISLPRYYLLEQRALAGLLAACEPRAKGPGRSAEHQIAGSMPHLLTRKGRSGKKRRTARRTKGP